MGSYCKPEQTLSRREAIDFTREKGTTTVNEFLSADENSINATCNDKGYDVLKNDIERRTSTDSLNIDRSSTISGSGTARRNSGENVSSRGSSEFMLPAAVPAKDRILSWRYVMVLLLHFSFVVSILQRNCLPIAMVCMTDQTASVTAEGEITNISLSSGNLAHNGTQEQNVYELDWHAEVQGLILTAVSFSSFIAPLLVDFIRPYLGNKGTLTLTTLLASALTLVTPMSARMSPWLLFTVRLVMGMFFGGTVTIMADSFSWWSPVLERQTMTAATLAGVNVGGILTSIVTGYLCLIPIDNGWPFIFYVFGSIGTMWAVLWHLLSSQKPEEHQFITDKEKQYILTNRVGMEEEWVENKHKIPYKVILSSPPVWALVTSVTCNQWTTNVYFTYLPAFLVKALDLSVQQAAIILSLLSACRFIGHVCWTSLSNLMLTTGKMETTTARKTAICIGFWLSALAQCCIIFLEEHHTWPVVALFGVIMFNVAVGSCVATVLPLEMAPRYSGFLSGFAQSIGCLLSISGPLIVGVVTPHGSLDEWNIVWIIVAVVFFVCGVTFLACGDASLQLWGHVSPDGMPTFALPFVTMGRRFSVIINSSHLTPMTSFGHHPHLSHLQSGIVSMNPKAGVNTAQGHDPQQRSIDTPNIAVLPKKSGVVNIGFIKDVKG